ncbi:MAG: cupin domain-containing protein [Candidatus Eisenbacteria bacterium]|uniref:Cupin domain-containing protein n=1 Tax=Eiseniibacteriota bacterium TaxID=2212470 RepID=A0A956LZ36_UNCEI|nr:cupin domain-containing protein [Candidatus Eisenbacteria bacterium]
MQSVREFAADKMKKVGVFETGHLFCDVYCLESGQSQKLHTHDDATKLYYIVEGEVHATIGTETRCLHPGDMAWADPGEPHGIENRSPGPVRVLVVMAPNPNRRS